MRSKEEVYQLFFDLFHEIMPENWDKVAYRAEVRESSVRWYYYFMLKDEDKYRDSSHLVDYLGVNKEEYKPLSRELFDLSAELQAIYKHEGLGKWDGMTLQLTSEGKFEIDFDFIDFEAQDLGTSREEWEAKYLNNNILDLFNKDQ